MENKTRADERGCQDDRKEGVETGVAKHRLAGPMSGCGACRAAFVRRLVASPVEVAIVAPVVTAQQPQTHRQQHQPERRREHDPALPPAVRRDGHDDRQRQRRPGQRPAERHRRQRTAARGIVVAPLAGHRGVAHQPLAEVAQQEDHHDQHPYALHQRHRHAGQRREYDDDRRPPPQVEAVDPVAGPGQERRAGQRARRIDRPELAVADRERRPNLGRKERDEPGLAEA